MCFADYIHIIIARTFGTMTELYTRLKRKAAKFKLVENALETKYVYAGTLFRCEHQWIRLGSTVTIDSDTFEMVEVFVYLLTDG